MEDTLERLGQTIRNALGASVAGYTVANGELTVNAKVADVVSVARFLRDDPACQFINIIDVTAVDWPSREKRFDVVYHFLSPRLNQRIRLKVATDETTPVPSLIDVFRGADWFERETYDLYGVLFTGHPDMRRILMWDEFKDYPMRKDYREPDDYEYEPTPHDDVLEKAKQHYAPRPQLDGAENITAQK